MSTESSSEPFLTRLQPQPIIPVTNLHPIPEHLSSITAESPTSLRPSSPVVRAIGFSQLGVAVVSLAFSSMLAFRIFFDSRNFMKSRGIKSPRIITVLRLIRPTETFFFIATIALSVQNVIFITFLIISLYRTSNPDCSLSTSIIYSTLFFVGNVHLIFGLESLVRSLKPHPFEVRRRWIKLISLLAVIILTIGSAAPSLIWPAHEQCLTLMLYHVVKFNMIILSALIFHIFCFLLIAAMLGIRLFKHTNIDPIERVTASRMFTNLILMVFLDVLILPFFVKSKSNNFVQSFPAHTVAVFTLVSYGIVLLLTHLFFRAYPNQFIISPKGWHVSPRKMFHMSGDQESTTIRRTMITPDRKAPRNFRQILSLEIKGKKGNRDTNSRGLISRISEPIAIPAEPSLSVGSEDLWKCETTSISASGHADLSAGSGGRNRLRNPLINFSNSGRMNPETNEQSLRVDIMPGLTADSPLMWQKPSVKDSKNDKYSLFPTNTLPRQPARAYALPTSNNSITVLQRDDVSNNIAGVISSRGKARIKQNRLLSVWQSDDEEDIEEYIETSRSSSVEESELTLNTSERESSFSNLTNHRSDSSISLATMHIGFRVSIAPPPATVLSGGALPSPTPSSFTLEHGNDKFSSP